LPELGNPNINIFIVYLCLILYNIATMIKLELFAIPLFIQNNFIIEKNLHDKIINYGNKLETYDRIISVCNGTQEHKFFDGDIEIKNILNEFIKNNFNTEISYQWLNVITENGFNVPHTHGNTQTMSGVLYLTKENSKIIFYGGFGRKDNITEIKPELFDLIIFPSYLTHLVAPSFSKSRRISLAFNTKELT